MSWGRFAKAETGTREDYGLGIFSTEETGGKEEFELGKMFGSKDGSQDSMRIREDFEWQGRDLGRTFD